VWKEPVAENDIVRGRGFAYALMSTASFRVRAAWSAWMPTWPSTRHRDVSVTRVVAGPGFRAEITRRRPSQIHGNVIQSTSRALMEEASFDRHSVTSREWGAYPIITFPDILDIDVLMCRDRISRRSASASPRPSRVPRRLPMRSSTATGVRFPNCRSRRNAFSGVAGPNQDAAPSVLP